LEASWRCSVAAAASAASAAGGHGGALLLCGCRGITGISGLLPTALAREVMKSPPSVCPSIRLFPIYLPNRLTVDLELLRVSSS